MDGCFLACCEFPPPSSFSPPLPCFLRLMETDEFGPLARDGKQISTQSYLDRLQKADFDPFDPVLQRRDWKVPLGVWWAVKRGRY